MKLWTTLLFLACATILCAQDSQPNLWEGYTPRSIGPAGMSGRVTAIDVIRDRPEVIYIGTASGGVWKSESGGTHWKPIFDDQPLQGIGSVALFQQNPSIVWAGTGEGNPRNSQTSGAGIYKSMNGGRTWNLMGLKETRTIHRIIPHPRDAQTVYAGALGSAWGTNPERGVYRTTDGGENWEKILYVNDSTGCAELRMDPSNPNKMFAAMWQYGRSPWFFESGGKGSGLYMTEDGGDSWTRLDEDNGLPKGKLGRIGIAIAPSSPNIVYALVESKNTALYRSEDGGYNFKKVADKNIGNRPFYYAEIYVDPQNENRVYNLYSVVSRSEDGGKTFETLLPYSSVHPDHHAFYIHPDNPDFLIDGNDGGLNISRDRGETWQFVETLPIAQFYHINYDNAIPYNVYGGMQDNGSWKGPAYTWETGGIQNSHWRELLFGDGFDVVPRARSKRFGYAMYQGGNVYEYDTKTGDKTYVQPVSSDTTELRFNWNAAIAQDPFDTCGLYFGSQFVHRSSDCGRSWERISPDLTTDDPEKQKQAMSGGLTIDATRAENHCTITSISPSELNPEVVWAGTDDGRLHVTRDGGDTWTDVYSNLPGAPQNGWVAQVVASTYTDDEAWVVVNHYRRNDWKPYAYHTTNSGKSWRRLVAPGDVRGHCQSIVQDPEVKELVFLGTENGLYYSLDGAKNWTKWKEGYPSASTMDLKIHPRERDLIIGTFGRSAWILDDIEPLRELARKGTGILDSVLYAFEPGVAILASVNRAKGSRFGADTHYEGENRSRGAMFTLITRPDKVEAQKDSTDGKKDKELAISVLDQNGDTIRSYSTKVDTGFTRISWNLRRDGVRMPSHSAEKEDSDPPSGRSVNPGRYKVVFQYMGKKDSTDLVVNEDPRLEYAEENYAYRDSALTALDSLKVRAKRGFDWLKDCEKTIARLNSAYELTPDSIQKSLKEEGKPVQQHIDSLKALFLTPDDFEGYDHVTQRVNDHLWSAESYLSNLESADSRNAKLAMDAARRETKKVLKAIRQFANEEWKNFRESMEKKTYSLFKDLPDELEE